MKKLLFLFAFLSLSFSSFTQVNLDSLWNIWSDKSNADTVRLEAVYYFMCGNMSNEFTTNPFFSQNPDSLLALITLVDEVTEASGSKKYELMLLRQKGIYLQNIQNFQEAVKLFEQALEMARTMKDKRLILMSTVTLAKGKNAWGFANGGKDIARLDQAEQHYLEAINLLELESFDFDKVSTKPDPELSIYAIVTLFHLGDINNFLQNIPKAIQYLEKALALAERSGDNYSAVHALLSLGNVQYSQKDYPNARQYIEKAIVLVQQLGDDHLFDVATSQLASVFLAERNYPIALRYFAKSLKLAEQGGDNHYIAHNLQSMGDLYTQVGEYAKAEDYLTRALSSMQAAGPQYQSEQISMYMGLHRCYIEQKSFSKAIVNDSTLFKFAGEFYLSLVPLGLAYLTEDYYKLGDYVKALEYGFQGLKANDEMPNNPNAAHINNLISLYIGNTYRKQNLPTKAITWCKKASTDHWVELQKDACECLYESYKALKQGNEALVYHEKFLLLSDSLNTEELGKNLIQAEFANKFLTDSLLRAEEKKSVQLAFEKDLLQETNKRNLFLAFGVIFLIMAAGLWHRLNFIRKKNKIIETEKLKAEQSERYKEQFLANMSHEIRTPMHAISGMINSLKRRKHSNEQDAYLNAMKISADNLLVILNDVLDMSKIESGKLEIDHVSMNVTEVVNQVVNILKYKAEGKGITIKTNINKDLPKAIIGDPVRLNQILMNLVSNAIKFTDQGQVEIVLTSSANKILFAIKDTGIGISNDQKQTIFDSFKQGDNISYGKHGGTGLGLAISKQLIELQDGNIWLESELGRGSTFFFELPLVISDHAHDAQVKLSEDQLIDLGKQLEGISILIAEDNEFNTMVVKDDLEWYIPNVNLTIVTNGKLALEQFKENSYDVILMDVQMPEMNGYDATRIIRESEMKNKEDKAIPIIAMTASLLKNQIDKCFDAGMNAYIPKPYTTIELINTLYTTIKKDKISN